MADMNELNGKLQIAIDTGNIDEVLKLVKEGADINTTFHGESSLDTAVIHGTTKDIMFLVDKGINIHGSDTLLSGLHLAAFDGNIELIDYFLDLGVDINSVTNDDHSVVSIVTRWFGLNNIFLLQHLIDKGADIYDKNGDLLKCFAYENTDKIEEYYSKYFPYAGSIKPVKR
jgi:ankyrin repeat protein